MAKVTKKYCEGRPSPYQVMWTEHGNRISRFFDTEEARDEFLQKYGFLEDMSFKALMSLKDSAIADIARVESLRGAVTYKELWDFWAKRHVSQRVVKLWDACNDYLRDLKESGKADVEHLKHARKILETLLEESFADKITSEVSRAEMENWLRNLPYSTVTIKNYRSTICAAWNWFERNNYVEKNCMKGLEIPKIELPEIGIFTVAETEQLFRANEKIDPEVCGLMALGLFAGMRTSAISRVAYDEIKMREGILTPAEKTKKNRRNFIENLPDNLWAWLERTPKSAFNWCERKWKKRRESALRRAGLLVNGSQLKTPDKDGKLPKKKIPPHNAFRHSFASYHVAWKRDFQDTALIMSHNGTSILFKHYRGVATKEDAEKYFDIYPTGYVKPENTSK